MAAANIDRFNALCGTIFAKLYEGFPVSMAFSPFDFYDQLTNGKIRNTDEQTLDREDGEFFLATFIWLGRHGYIHHGIAHTSTMQDCVLTAQALGMLNATPESLKQKDSSLGEQLVKCSKEGMTDKVKELASDFLSKAVVFGTKAATDWVG
ncbi:hypothetical protein A1354_12280 [Pseudomonas asplenii]|nr:hypothetical protein [Pseudomonas asplenii]PNG40943.1 hypothetical protein A1354_12280 [Pseudomonas asplenii]